MDTSHEKLLGIIENTPVTLFSFVDCPWCLLAKKLLQQEPYNQLLDSGMLQIIELEHLRWTGKELRASIALATGRTSMPACFIGRLCIGGYTDGFNFCDQDNSQREELFIPRASYDLRMIDASGMKDMHEKGTLQNLIKEVCKDFAMVQS